MKAKSIISLIAVVIFVLMTTIPVSAASKSSTASSKESESRLLESLNSENFDVRVNTTISLGEIKSTKAVIPLLKILHNEESEPLRIVAALSLIKIGNGIGVYQVKQAAKYDDSPRVRRLCSIFYNAFINDKVAE